LDRKVDMSLFSTIEKQLAGFASRKASLEKKIATKTAEERELADILVQEAAALAAKEAAAQELAECKQVCYDLESVVSLMDAVIADLPIITRGLDKLEGVCVRGYLGGPEPVGQTRATLNDAAAFAADVRARLERAQQRIKELEG